MVDSGVGMLIGTLGWLLLGAGLAPACAADTVRTIDPPESGFFSKAIDCDGISIKAHRDVSDAALHEASTRVRRLLRRLPVVRRNLVTQGAEVHVIGKEQATSDLPEWRHMKGKNHWDSDILFDDRTRGMGGLISSCGEENLLKLPGDRYKDHRDICSHEFAHGILNYGVSPNIRQAFEDQYKRAKGKGLWPSYAGSNVDEYFAELTMWYLGSRGDYGRIQPPPEPGPEWLKRYDTDGYALMDAFYKGRLKVEPVPTTREKRR